MQIAALKIDLLTKCVVCVRLLNTIYGDNSMRLTKDDKQLQPGQLLKALRDRKGWTLRECGLETHVSYTQISDMEKGHVKIGHSHALKFAETFGVKPKFFMDKELVN